MPLRVDHLPSRALHSAAAPHLSSATILISSEYDPSNDLLSHNHGILFMHLSSFPPNDPPIRPSIHSSVHVFFSGRTVLESELLPRSAESCEFCLGCCAGECIVSVRRLQEISSVPRLRCHEIFHRRQRTVPGEPQSEDLCARWDGVFPSFPFFQSIDSDGSMFCGSVSFDFFVPPFPDGLLLCFLLFHQFYWKLQHSLVPSEVGQITWHRTFSQRNVFCSLGTSGKPRAAAGFWRIGL